MRCHGCGCRATELLVINWADGTVANYPACTRCAELMARVLGRLI